MSVNIKISVYTLLLSIIRHLPLLLSMNSAIHKTLKFTCWYHSGSIQFTKFLD